MAESGGVDRARLLELREKTATVRRIHLFPVKSLEGAAVPHAVTAAGGGLAGDRQFAFFSLEHGGWIRAKDFPALIRVRTQFDFARQSIRVENESGAREFDLRLEQAGLSEWMSAHLGHRVTLKESPARGFFDDSKKQRFGVSLISTATLQRLCTWFPGMALEEMRRRLRTNIEVDGVEPFWEECLIGQAEDGKNTAAPAGVRIGGARFVDALSCPRCSVPERDSWTAERDAEFQTRLAAMREKTLPGFTERSAYKMLYSVAVRLAGIPTAENAPGVAIAVGDEVRLEG